MGVVFERLFSRRTVIAAIPAAIFGGSARAATETIGEAADVRGKVVARQVQDVRGLASGAALMLKDSVETAEKSFARLELAGRTTAAIRTELQVPAGSMYFFISQLMERSHDSSVLLRISTLRTNVICDVATSAM